MSAAAGVTVGKVFQSRQETLRLDLEILAGSGGLDLCITSPYVQKTGLALAGFHEHLRPGRTLVFGNSGVRRRSETILIGTCPELTRHHMEIRGLGVINIQDLFGIAATRTSKRIELVAQLERWEPRRDCPPSREALRRGLTLAILVQLAGLDQLDESEIEELADPGEEQ